MNIYVENVLKCDEENRDFVKHLFFENRQEEDEEGPKEAPVV